MNVQDLQTIIATTIEHLGFDMVDLEIVNRGKLLRVFIDKLAPESATDSVTIDDCVLVSNQLGNVLAVEHDIDYDRLEVSSPGMDRVLKREKDFIRFIGETVLVKLRIAVDNRKKISGVLLGYENSSLEVDENGVTIRVPLTNVEKVRLNPRFGK